MKKGELTSQQIVMLVILVASFAVILFFIFRLNLGEQTNQELCRNSVILAGKSALKGENSLSCYRTYKCLTSDGTCEGLNDPQKIEVDTEEEVYRELANEIADCWWMFGEGKVNYIGDDLKSQAYCSICFQTVLDDSLGKVVGSNGVSRESLYKYMSNAKRPGTNSTYLQFLYGTTADIKVADGAKFGNLPLSKQYFVIMGIKSGASQTGWIAIGATGAALATGAVVGFFTAPISIPAAIGAIIGGVGGGFGGDYLFTVFEGESGAQFIQPSLIGANSEEYKALNCSEIVTFS